MTAVARLEAGKKYALPQINEERVSRCQDALMRFIQIPDFTYEKRGLLALGLREGFKNPEIEAWPA